MSIPQLNDPVMMGWVGGEDSLVDIGSLDLRFTYFSIYTYIYIEREIPIKWPKNWKWRCIFQNYHVCYLCWILGVYLYVLGHAVQT